MGKYFKIILLLLLFFTSFAGTKISDLSQETNIQDTDEVLIRRGSDNYRAQVQYLPSANPSDQFNKIKNAYYVSTNASITDYADTAQSGSIADVITNEMSGANGDLVLPGNKIYQIKQSLTIPATAQLMPQKGAIIDTDISIRDAIYKWTLSGSGTSEYYLEASGGGNPNINEPDDVAENDSRMTEATVGSLAVGAWDWGDNDTLGYNTVYVRLSDSTDPDGKAANYVEACYTITINSPFDNGLFQVFLGSGKVIFASGAVKKTYPEWWYDDSGDWESAIEDAALSMQINGGTVQLSGNMYIVWLTTTNWIKIPSGITVQGIGAVSIIKVANGNPDYRTVFGANGAESVNTNNVKFLNFKIDQNINNVTGTPAIGSNVDQFCLYFVPTSGADFEVAGMYFDCCGINAAVFNSPGLTDVHIHDNTFYFTEKSAVDYDNTPIYIDAKFVSISNNIVRSAAIGDGASGIELHGGPGVVNNNIIEKFENGIHLVAESDTEAERDNQITCSGNSITDANSGIYLWGIGSTTQRELNNITVANNTIQLSQATHNYTYSSFGIGGYPAIDNRGAIKNVTITGNTIQFEDESGGRSVTESAYFAGIGLNSLGDMSSITVVDNTILRAPGPGIVVGNSRSGGSTKQNIRIADNNIVNAGQNISITQQYRAFICVDGYTDSVLSKIIIENNHGSDNWATMRAYYSIYTFAGGTITDCLISNNSFIGNNGTLLRTITGDYLPIYHKVANYTIKAQEDGAIFTNLGATGTITFTLPAALSLGLTYRFYTYAAQNIHIDPNGTDGIGGAPNVGKYLLLDAQNECVTLKCLSYGGWTIITSVFWDETFEP